MEGRILGVRIFFLNEWKRIMKSPCESSDMILVMILKWLNSLLCHIQNHSLNIMFIPNQL